MKIKVDKTEKETPQKFLGRFTEDGGLDFGTYTKIHLKKFMKENPNMAFELKPLLPESNEQRGFFEGAVCPLLAFYQEGMDYRNSKDVHIVREWFKIEFNGDLVEIGGKVHRIAKSTRNQLNQGFLERVIGYIEDNYAPPKEALNPEKYKLWKDTIYPFGGADTYLGYLIDLKLLQ